MITYQTVIACVASFSGQTSPQHHGPALSLHSACQIAAVTLFPGEAMSVAEQTREKQTNPGLDQAMCSVQRVALPAPLR